MGPEVDCAGLISYVKNKRRVCLTEEFWKKPYCRGPHLIKKNKPGVPPPPPITDRDILKSYAVLYDLKLVCGC